jgi:hypothetical protein
MRIAAEHGNIDSLIRTWITVAAATLSLLLPLSWVGSAALFLAIILPLGIFYPLPIGPRTQRRVR